VLQRFAQLGFPRATDACCPWATNLQCVAVSCGELQCVAQLGFPSATGIASQGHQMPVARG